MDNNVQLFKYLNLHLNFLTEMNLVEFFFLFLRKLKIFS